MTNAGEYSSADDACAKLLGQLADSKFGLATPEQRDNILQFYSGVPASVPIDSEPQ